MFGEKLRKLRTSKHMTQQELAKILRISSSTIGMYEQNRRSPDIETLKIIADYFQCSTDYLLDKEKDLEDINFPNRLKELRLEKGLTQIELSKYLNIDKTTYTHYEKGTIAPDIKTLKSLANYFNVSVDYLLRNSNDKVVPNYKNDTPSEKISKLIKENNIRTLAAHFDGKDITDDDVEDIKNFIEFVVEKRKKRGKND
ncbi:helix-turn-helix domain-containing protein [Clostridium sp. AWRP]|uniref:helix-turn-helix domain-containing protein n=1 Tax=Clostridium sp. AWRP TaxID=2212991 RepID=UPI000FD9E791|nr:helix-turn-helix domain-containing protein [Clostridium sp. AWRP]AZV57940.1 helix-turn-helix domain-containing protein [Clostridium sp. AWRP]